MNEENKRAGENLANASADMGGVAGAGSAGRDFLFRAEKKAFEERLPLNAIPPMRHWTFGENSRCHIQPGDTAWVTVFPDEQHLTLVASFRVGFVVAKEAADVECGKGFEFHVPAECLTNAYLERLREGLRGGLAPADILAAVAAGGMRLKMSYEPFELRRHMFAAGGPQEWEFPKFLDISDWAASVGISYHRWSWQKLTPNSAMRLREIWQSAKAGFQRIPEGISLSKVKVKPAFTIVRR